MSDQTKKGHLLALITIIMWGTTFISTKVLLVDFNPVEILFIRFIFGIVVLYILHPHRMTGISMKQEAMLAAAGFCGICLYYLLENIALTYTMASNVGVIVSVAPIFTVLLSRFFLKEEGKLGWTFYVGFLAAMAGIMMISFNGTKMELNPAGDFLALFAAFVWACYSILTKKISSYGYPTILTTRKMFIYGVIFMIPAWFIFDCKLELYKLANPVYLMNYLYLSVGAGALGFVAWNYAVKIVGVVKTSIYIYLVPVVTVITSALILHEEITVLSAVGTILILAGLFLSEGRLPLRKEKKENMIVEDV